MREHTLNTVGSTDPSGELRSRIVRWILKRKGRRQRDLCACAYPSPGFCRTKRSDQPPCQCVVEQDAHTTAGSCLQGSQRGLYKILLAAGLDSGQASRKMRLHAGLSGAERALFLRLSSAHRATH